MSAPDFMQKAATRKLVEQGVANADALLWCSSEAVNGGFVLKLATTRILTRGPRKGEEAWNTKDSVTLIVSKSEVRDEEARFERESGHCFVCGGSGQEWAGWSKDTGSRTKPCERCHGTGKAP